MTDIPQTSPFHRGEQAIQDRVGVRERAPHGSVFWLKLPQSSLEPS